MANIYIDVHQLVTVGPHNMNRGEDGAPKTVTFGGVKRSRLSSQSQKAAVRKRFFHDHGDRLTSIRSRKIPRLMAAELRAMDPTLSEPDSFAIIGCAMAMLTSPKTADAVKKVRALISDAEQKAAAGTPDTDDAEDVPTRGREKGGGYVPDLLATFMVSAEQAKRFAEVVKRHMDSGVDFVGDAKLAQNKTLGKELLASVTEGLTPDVALFGRMYAANRDLDSAAAAQVAHAFGVSPFVPEEDYFTAADDFVVQTDSPVVKQFRDEVGVTDSGADMLERNQFTAGTMYRFSTLNVSHLADLMGDPAYAVEVARGYVKAFLETLPSGAKNAYAQASFPDTVVISVRSRQPVNYAGAFEVPVANRLEAQAVLGDYAAGHDRMFGRGPDDSTFVVARVGQDKLAEALGADPSAESLDSVLDSMSDAVTGLMA